MKKIIIVCFVLSACICFAQKKDAKELFAEVENEWKLDDNGNVSFTKIIEVPGVSKDELYARALSYFTYNYKSGDDVIQVKDKEQGLIIGKGIYGKVFVGGSLVVSSYDATHILRIDVKDGRVRVILSIQEFKIRNSGMNGTVGHSTALVSQCFPFSKDAMKKQMMKTIYNTCQRVNGSMAGIEKSLKEGNTGSKVEDSDW